MIRRFAAIGDVHGEDAFLAAALDHLASERLDAILCVGDIVDGRGDVERCCELLRARNALVVRGNHERWVLADTMRQLRHATLRDDLPPRIVEWLSALPATRTLKTIAGDLLLCHAVGEDDMIRLREDDEGYALTENRALQAVLASGVELMVCGHTHQPMVRTLSGLTVINAGTLHRDDAPGFVVVDLDAKHAKFFTIDDAGTLRIHESVTIPFGRAGQDVWGSGF